MSDDLRHEHFQLLYRRCLESVAPSENQRMRERTKLTWRDTKVSQMWGRMGARNKREFRAEPKGK